MLELNAGTGLDAVYFAQKGIYIHATDLSEGMIKQLKKKQADLHLNSLLTIQQCSFTQLNEIEGKTFDHIFSNFGGLNCISDLRMVTQHFDGLLNKNGMVTLVIMPRFCPWEIVSVLKGNLKTAFRRFKKNGTPAHIEGEYFDTWYFNKKDIVKAFNNSYELISIKGLASLSPPPDRVSWVRKHALLYKLLIKSDEKLMDYFPFNRCADHLIITMKKLT